MICALGLTAATEPVAAQPASTQAGNCGREAAAIRKAETELPRLDVAPPDDKQIVCTNIVFARRLVAHVAQCPGSPHARAAGGWQRTGAQYAAQFNDRGCKPAIRGYRG
jgi:hypothetical protein